jgi:hypothetical protein
LLTLSFILSFSFLLLFPLPTPNMSFFLPNLFHVNTKFISLHLMYFSKLSFGLKCVRFSYSFFHNIIFLLDSMSAFLILITETSFQTTINFIYVSFLLYNANHLFVHSFSATFDLCKDQVQISQITHNYSAKYAIHLLLCYKSTLRDCFPV